MIIDPNKRVTEMINIPVGEVVTAETKTVTYTAGVPDERTTTDEFKLEGNLKDLILNIKIQYDTDGSTAPTAPSNFPSQDRMLAILRTLKFKVDGKTFFEMKGGNLRQLISLLNEDDEYHIDELGITLGISDELKYASIPLPISKPKTIRELDYEFTLEDDTVLSANDKFNIDSVAITFTPIYGESDLELQVLYTNKTIDGLEDYDINRNLGNLMALIIDGYNTTVNIQDVRFKVDKISLIELDYMEMIGQIKKDTHGVVDYSTYPNVIVIRFDDTIDVSDLEKTIIAKLQTSTSQVFTITQIFIEKVNPEIIKDMSQYNADLAHKTSGSQDIKTVPKTTVQKKTGSKNNKKKKTFLGFKI